MVDGEQAKSREQHTVHWKQFNSYCLYFRRVKKCIANAISCLSKRQNVRLRCRKKKGKRKVGMNIVKRWQGAACTCKPTHTNTQKHVSRLRGNVLLHVSAERICGFPLMGVLCFKENHIYFGVGFHASEKKEKKKCASWKYSTSEQIEWIVEMQEK